MSLSFIHTSILYKHTHTLPKKSLPLFQDITSHCNFSNDLLYISLFCLCFLLCNDLAFKFTFSTIKEKGEKDEEEEEK